jgi:hypothetical protein
MSNLAAGLQRLVRQRAADRCEYCLAHQSLQVATFHVEHIIPVSAGGVTAPENLALSCPSCNLHKAQRTVGIDSMTEAESLLFHPRLNKWSDHFSWLGYDIVGLTPVGRATIAALGMNHPRRIRIRMAEEVFRLFPSAPAGAD